MVNKVCSIAHLASFKQQRNGYGHKNHFKLLKRCKILRLRKFIYHVGMYPGHLQAFFRRFYLLCCAPHRIQRSPPSDVVTDPCRRNPGTGLEISLCLFLSVLHPVRVSIFNSN